MAHNQASYDVILSLLKTPGSLVGGYRVVAAAKNSGLLFNILLYRDSVYYTLFGSEKELVPALEGGPGEEIDNINYKFTPHSSIEAAHREFLKEAH